MTPGQTRAAIGEELLGHVTRLTGPPCADSSGNRALQRLGRRLRGAEAGRLVLVPGGAVESLHLPGGTIVLLLIGTDAALSIARREPRITLPSSGVDLGAADDGQVASVMDLPEAAF